MTESEGSGWIPDNFLALTEEQSNLAQARVVLIPIPYDSTTSYRSGARYGPRAIIEASASLEDYDLELDLDVSQVGIHTTPTLEPHMGGPKHMTRRIREAVNDYIKQGKMVGTLGGEHSVVIGSVQAHIEAYPKLTVLYLDAHADLCDQHMGTSWGHASGARRIHEMCPLVLVGVRSMCQEERDYIRQNAIPAFFWPQTESQQRSYIDKVIRNLGPEVYLSIDLDVFDPSVMAAVGTPEPGGMDWYQVTRLIRAVAESRRIVGFDINELAPEEGPKACSYTAAKLVYKLIAYTNATKNQVS